MLNLSATADGRTDLYALSRDEMRELLATWGYSDYYAGRVWESLYRDLNTTPYTDATLRPDLGARLQDATRAGRLQLLTETASSDGHTRKFLLGLPDGQAIETVLMDFRGRSTACISTQVGCAMGCVFCATGQMGFRRHLTSGEIVAQVVFAAQRLRDRGNELRNVVLMGMGEPLHNYDATMKAVDTMLDHHGLTIAPRFITISTVGLVPGIRRLTAEKRPIRLAVSLHGATDAGRSALVPPARRWPLSELMDACREYCDTLQRHIFFEWTLIAGQNDSPEQAHCLGQLLAGLPAHVNLIPLNPTLGYDGRPTHSPEAKAFQTVLRSYDIPSTVRQRRGIDVAAGCGQLATVAR